MQHVFTLPNMQHYHRVLHMQIRHNFLHCNMTQGLNLEILSLIPSHIHVLIFVHKWNLHLYWTQNLKNTTINRLGDSGHLERSCVMGWVPPRVSRDHSAFILISKMTMKVTRSSKHQTQDAQQQRITSRKTWTFGNSVMRSPNLVTSATSAFPPQMCS